MKEDEASKLISKVDIISDWFSENVEWYTISNRKALELLKRLDEVEE